MLKAGAKGPRNVLVRKGDTDAAKRGLALRARGWMRFSLLGRRGSDDEPPLGLANLLLRGSERPRGRMPKGVGCNGRGRSKSGKPSTVKPFRI